MMEVDPYNDDNHSKRTDYRGKSMKLEKKDTDLNSDEKSERIQQLLEDNDCLERQVTKISNQVDVLTSTLDTLQKDCRAKESRISDLENQIDELQKRCQEQQEDLEYKEQCIGNYKQQLAEQCSNAFESESEPVHFRKLFLGGLDYKTTEETLIKHFEQFGEVIDCVVIKDPVTKSSRGFGFITYKTLRMVDDAQKARPHKIDGKEIETKRVVPKQDAGKPEVQAKVKKIFVGGLKDDIEERHLQEYFCLFGNIESITIEVQKETGKRRGFAFVEFDDYDPVDKLVLMRNHTIKGKRTEVKKAISKQELEGLKRPKDLGIPGPKFPFGGGIIPEGPSAICPGPVMMKNTASDFCTSADWRGGGGSNEFSATSKSSFGGGGTWVGDFGSNYSNNFGGGPLKPTSYFQRGSVPYGAGKSPLYSSR